MRSNQCFPDGCDLTVFDLGKSHDGVPGAVLNDGHCHDFFATSLFFNKGSR